MASRFLDLGNSNPTQKALRDNEPTPSRSHFNLSRVVQQNMEIGRIHVIDVIETIPGDTFTNLNYIIGLQSRNPTVKAQQTGLRMYVHGHFMRWSDIWEGAQNYIDMGTTGKISKQMPTLETQINIGDDTFELATPMSLIDEIGAPAVSWEPSRERIKMGFGVKTSSATPITKTKTYGPDTINALPFAMYQSICLNRYFDRNLVQSNQHWVPENQNHFILPYNATTVAKLDYDNPSGYIETDIQLSNGNYIDPNGKTIIPQDDNTHVYLAMPRYGLKRGNYYTTGLPFGNLIRGDIPTIDLSSIVANMDFSDVVENAENGGDLDGIIAMTKNKKIAGLKRATGGTRQSNLYINTETATTGANANLGLDSTMSSNVYNIKDNGLLDILNRAKVNATMQANIDMAALNALEALTVFRQRMALTNGKYNEMVKAQFGYNPEAPNHDPIYIGGFYMDLDSNAIVNTADTGNSPLGTKAGRMDTTNAGQIGQFHCKDYGYIMVTAVIISDTYYNQGLERQITRKRQDEVYFPIFNNLAPQAILNKELFYTGNSEIDEDIFAWTERYSDYKSRTNRTKGLIAIENLDDSTYVMQEWLDSTPTLTNKYMSLSQENIDMGIFTTTTEPPFVAAIGQNVEVTRAMPYVTMPAGLRGGRE